MLVEGLWKAESDWGRQMMIAEALGKDERNWGKLVGVGKALSPRMLVEALG